MPHLISFAQKGFVVCCLWLCCFSSYALAYTISIDHLGTPSIYDNVGGPWDYGQTFTAESIFVSGFQVYIGDPSRPNDPSVNELSGPADLVLYNASNFSAPFEIAGNSVIPSGTIVNGLSTFLFDTPVPVEIGTKYFFIILADDTYGIGLQSQTNSTYAGGGESRLGINFSGSLEIIEGGRDLSFAVLSPEVNPVPEPATMLLLASGLVGLVGLRKKFRHH